MAGKRTAIRSIRRAALAIRAEKILIARAEMYFFALIARAALAIVRA